MASIKMRVAIDKLKKKLASQLKDGQHVNVGVNNNSEVATYATYLEYGWTQRVTSKQAAFFKATLGYENAPKEGSILVMPARPTFHSTATLRAKPWADIVGAIIRNAKGSYNSSTILTTVGSVAMSDIKQTIAQGGTSEQAFAPRSPLTMRMLEYRARSTGHAVGGNSATTKPLVLSGKFLNSITYQIED